ncbi:hypothetical protein Tco_0733793 [Tanacetum coccineum]
MHTDADVDEVSGGSGSCGGGDDESGMDEDAGEDEEADEDEERDDFASEAIVKALKRKVRLRKEDIRFAIVDEPYDAQMISMNKLLKTNHSNCPSWRDWD